MVIFFLLYNILCFKRRYTLRGEWVSIYIAAYLTFTLITSDSDMVSPVSGCQKCFNRPPLHTILSHPSNQSR